MSVDSPDPVIVRARAVFKASGKKLRLLNVSEGVHWINCPFRLDAHAVAPVVLEGRDNVATEGEFE